MIPDTVYEPAEDSQMLFDSVIQNFDFKNFGLDICEVGVGSGYSIINIAKKYPKNNFYGSDINLDAIDYVSNEFNTIGLDIKLENKSFFEGFLGKKFDLVLFNAPYLPCEDGENFEDLDLSSKALYAGKKGYEVIEQFLYKLYDHLNSEGICFLIISSLSNPDYLRGILEDNRFEFEISMEKGLFFETLYCLKISKSKTLKELTEENVQNVRFLARGKHSVVLDGRYNGCDVIIKTGKEQHVYKEAYFLEKLSDLDFVPKMFLHSKNFVVREKFSGLLIEDFFHSATGDDIRIVIDNIFKATCSMDQMGINKFEMTHPYKHIYVQEDLSIKMIDYERSIFSTKPKNTTQFLQYLKRFIKMFEKKGVLIDVDKIMKISKSYKDNFFQIHLKDIEK